MDACSACFEQKTVFTQQVLAKALTKMVCTYVLWSVYEIQALYTQNPSRIEFKEVSLGLILLELDLKAIC